MQRESEYGCWRKNGRRVRVSKVTVRRRSEQSERGLEERGEPEGGVGETHGGGFAQNKDPAFCFGLRNDFRIRRAGDRARKQAPAESLIGCIAGISTQEEFGWVAGASEAKPALDQAENK